MRSLPVFAVVCVVMLLVVPIHPVLANPHVSETESALFPGVRGITVTEVGIGDTRTRESLVEIHTGLVDVRIRDPLATSTVKRLDIRSGFELTPLGGALARAGYDFTGVTAHHYQTSVTADGVRGVPQSVIENGGLVRSKSDPSMVTADEVVTYYTFTNSDTKTSRVVMGVQVIKPDGAPVGDRKIAVTPIMGDQGIVGSDELMVYEPQGGTFSSGSSRSARGGGIETGEPDERTPLLTHTGVAVTTVMVEVVGATAGACVASGGIACPVMLGALVVFAGVNVVGYIINTASYTVESQNVAEDAKIREFTLVENSIGGGTYVPRHSHLVYRRDGSVQVTTPSPWWKRWSSKGLVCMYVPLTTDDSESYAVTATRDIEAPSGSEFVFPTPNSMVVKYKGDTILDAVVDVDSGCGQHQEQSRHSRQGFQAYKGFIEYAHKEHVSGITDFTAYWDVPTAPTTKEQHSYISLWTGIGGNNGMGVVQPVLDWDHQETGKYWMIAAWAIRPGGEGDSTCGPKGHSERKTVSTGNKIKGRLYYMNNKWNIEITDVTRGGTTKCSSNIVGNSDVEVFGGVLEGAKLVYAGGDTNLPGSTTFYDMSYNTRVSLTGYVDPKAQEHFGGLSVEIVKNPSRVVLHTANSR